MVLPPNVSEADFNAALNEFRSAVGASWVFSFRRRRRALSRFLLHLLGRAGRAGRLRRRGSGEGRGSTAGGSHRQQVQDSVVSHLHRAQPHVRRLGAHDARQRGRRPEAHEPHPRGRRKARVCAGRTRRFVFRSLQLHPRAQPEADARCAGSRMGQPSGQQPGPRRRATLRPTSAITSARIAAWKW